MSVAYLDTSAAVKLILKEEHSDALFDAITSDPSFTLVSSWLLHTELHCAVDRREADLPAERLADVLDRVKLADLSRRDLIAGAALAPLRAADAIHLAVALRLDVDEIITYDLEMADAARRAGLRVMAPVDPAASS